MARTLLITGGARSGKSSLAERLALRPTGRAIHIATARLDPGDAEMADRIAAHRARRGPEWESVHAPLDLAGALDASDRGAGGPPRLVDCLTLWVSNLMLEGRDTRAEGAALAAALARTQAPVILVTNEVGAGIVPDNTLARAFRDHAGWLNQTIAHACDELWLCVAGHPLRIKPNDHAL